jgi:hypothetical protein
VGLEGFAEERRHENSLIQVENCGTARQGRSHPGEDAGGAGAGAGDDGAGDGAGAGAVGCVTVSSLSRKLSKLKLLVILY